MRPKTKEQRDRFWDFRNDDIYNSFFIQGIVKSSFYVFNVTLYLVMRERKHLPQLVGLTVYTFLHWAFYLFARRYKNLLVYLLPFLFVVIEVVWIKSTEAQLQPIVENDYTEGFLRGYQIFKGFYLLMGELWIFMIFLAPTSTMCALVYTPIFIASCVWLAALVDEFDNPAILEIFFLHVLAGFYVFASFYMV